MRFGEFNVRTNNQRLQKYRAGLLKNGLRSVEIWVPDTRQENFSDECKRQSLLIRSDSQEAETLRWLENSSDKVGWQ
jgi:hypothetical protein